MFQLLVLYPHPGIADKLINLNPNLSNVKKLLDAGCRDDVKKLLDKKQKLDYDDRIFGMKGA